MDSSDSYSPDDSGHLVTGVEVMVGFLFIMTIMAFVSYLISLCRAHRLIGVLPYHQHHGTGSPQDPKASPGLDEASLRAFPRLLYSKANVVSLINKTGGNSIEHFSTSVSCSVCLADYDESDVIRVLPDCGHVFHLKCVDSWLRLNPTCPVCRKLPCAASPADHELCKITVEVD